MGWCDIGEHFWKGWDLSWPLKAEVGKREALVRALSVSQEIKEAQHQLSFPSVPAHSNLRPADPEHSDQMEAGPQGNLRVSCWVFDERKADKV